MLNLIKPRTLSKLVCGALCMLSLSSTAFAQRGNKDKDMGSPKILSNLPTFFVDDAVFPAYLKQIYKVDATRLAVRLLNKEQRVTKQTVRVPEELVKSIYNALIAVRVSDYGAIDSIAKMYYVRTFAQPSVESIVLLFEHDDPILDPIKQRKDSTGNAGVNRIIKEHNLVMSKLSYMDEERSGLVLQSREPINIGALTHKLFMEEGIGCIDEKTPWGDGNDINIERSKTGWDITYSVKFGNCQNQCPKSYNWKFSVSEGGEVTYLGGAGDVIPTFLATSAASKKFPDVLKK
jgi:hypothetical protein